ncbi:SDA1 family protein [Babesia bovis T2Bo]|uniref:Protein SDA1 n=1 Tax=Babesia bovis TaxID=5865 RepID=A7AW71_BABBO|nr:SDA1 family protein [Babesia bovis T2Bo]EDO05299.1 SDA1 family protein [Babesia bovis T2Bo]|eukprot:XP_001608867.1 hypothetical protein [Babesia bovis T2Bo]
MEGLDALILQIRREPEAHRADFLMKWEEFTASFNVLHLTPHLYNADVMSLLSFVAQCVPYYAGDNDNNVDLRYLPQSTNDSKPSRRPSLKSVSTSLTDHSSTNDGGPGSAVTDQSCLGRELCMMLIDFIKSYRKGLNIKMLKQMLSTTFLLRSKRLIDMFTIWPEWLALLDLDDRDARKRLFVFIVRDLTIVSQQVKDANVIRAMKRLFYDYLRAKSLQVQLLTCCICVEMHKRRLWRDEHTVNNIAQCALASNLKLVLAGAHFLLGTRNHFDVAFEALEDLEEEIASLETLNKQQGHSGVGAHSKKSEGRQNRLSRSKKSVAKQLERRKKRLELCQIREFAAIDELHDPQKFTERLFERCRNKDVTFGAKLILLHLISLVIARHKLLVPSFYSFLLKYINHKQRLVTKILAISAQAVHTNLPPGILDPLLTAILDQFVSEDRSNEVITAGINTLREIASRAPLLFPEDMVAQIVEFRNIKNKAVSTATKSFINLYREHAPELLHPTLRGREAGTRLTQAKRGKLSKAPIPFSDAQILSQEDFRLKNYMAGMEEVEETATDEEIEMESDGISEDLDEDDVSMEETDEYSDSDSDDLNETTPDEPKRKRAIKSDSSDDTDDEEDEEDRIKVNPDDLIYGSKRKRVAAEARREAAKARLERKKQHHTAESRAGNKQSTTNRVKARNKPVLMTMQSKRVRGKQSQNIAEKLASLKRHLKSLKTGNVKHKKRRR